jgi:hypothetical protein
VRCRGGRDGYGQPSAEIQTQASVGLALEIDNGVGAPLSLRAGQTFHVNQIDIRASLTTTADEDVAGLDAAGDFAALDWGGVAFIEEGPSVANGDGTFTRRRFYRDAKWMRAAGTITIIPVTFIDAPTYAAGPRP